MRTTKINSQQLNVDILYEHSIIRELGFINREGLITNGESTSVPFISSQNIYS